MQHEMRENYKFYLNAALFVIATITLGIGISNYIKFVESVELTAKNIELTHRPIVFIKESVVPNSDEERKNPFKHSFIVTNRGQLPARDVEIISSVTYMIGPQLSVNQTQSNELLTKAVIYPNSDLVFWFKDIIYINDIPESVEAVFTINYSGEGLEKEVSETMKFIFSKQTDYTWKYVGPEATIIKYE